MYNYVPGIRNQLLFLFSSSGLNNLNLHLTGRRVSDHILHAIIEECNRQLGNLSKKFDFFPNEEPG